MVKYCSKHASDITDGLKRKDLWKLVETQPEVMREQSRLWLAGQATAADFNPLVVVTLEINTKAAQWAQHLSSPIAEYCPLCEVERAMRIEVADVWIDNCTDAVLAVALANGVIKPT